jgi:uncharacterized protein YraI
LRREKEIYKTMSDHNHTGSIWSNATAGVRRHTGPGQNFPVNKILPAGQELVVLCYSRGDSVSFVNPYMSNTSDAWDYVVTKDDDSGGYVADVYVNTGADITVQLGAQGVCNILAQSITTHQSGPLG